MGDFSADWLALREPVDHAARSAALTRAVFAALPRDEAIRVLDLGCGTGSNLRYLEATLKGSRHTEGRNDLRHRATLLESQASGGGLHLSRGATLSGSHQWLLVDSDPALLARVPPAGNVTTIERDLAILDPALFADRTLVTASALLDLVSEEWLRTLAALCRRQNAAVLFALTYDGRMQCTPEEPEDEIVRALVNRHQRTDKGFGPALGPEAAASAERSFAALGYRVRREPSDWLLDAAQPDTPDLKVGPTTPTPAVGPSFSSGALQRMLIEGWAQAATALEPQRSTLVDEWKRKRLAHVDAGRSRIVVGHQDLCGIRL